MSILLNINEAINTVQKKTIRKSELSNFSSGSAANRNINGEIVSTNTNGYYDGTGNWVDYFRCDSDVMNSGKGCAP